MKFFKLSHILILISVFLNSASIVFGGDQLPTNFQIIPQPKKVELLKGPGLKFGDLKTILIEKPLCRPVLPPFLDVLPETDDEGAGVLTLKLQQSETVPDSPEGYVLTIQNGQVEIIAKSEAGIFYGCQTLQQLLEDSRDTGDPIPACRITDYPSLSYRAVHFDVKHHLDNMHYYYQSIDRLARYKINAIIFEFEDKLRYRRQPLIGAPHAISIEEMAALTKYARERHIEITPLVQGLGHATFILKHPEYAHLRELEYNRWAFCPMDEGTYQVLFDMYLDAMEATPGSRYLHIGGDEVGNIGLCPRCKDFAEKEGVFALNLYWLNKVCQFVSDHGRIPIFWDDQPFKYAGLWQSVQRGKNQSEDEAAAEWKKGLPILNKMLDRFPKNAVYMRWNYGPTRYPGSIRALQWYKNSGLKVMIASAAQTTDELLPGYERVRYIKEFSELAADYGIEGSLCTAWDDSSPLMETYWRGFIAAAEYCWSPGLRDLPAFERAYFQREFGPECTTYPELYRDLSEAARFWARAFFPSGTRRSRQNALLELPGIAHWEKPSTQKEKTRIDYAQKLIGLPDKDHPGQWSKKYQDRLKEAKKEIKRYQNSSKILSELLKKSRRNRYHLQVLQVINNFQVTAPRLLLALKECDTANKGKQKEGLQLVKEALEEFKTSWEDLEKTYAKIRFLSYPPNYVKDRYFHFASQREDLSFMIQAEELYHELIRQWLEEMKK